MYSNNMIEPAEKVEDPTGKRLLQIKPLKILGAIHISLGAVMALLSTIGIITSLTMKDELCQSYYNNMYNGHVNNYYNRCGNVTRIMALIFGSVCLVLSGWFIMTGALPLCMTEKRERSWRCLKTAFMVCCILSAVLFGFIVLCLAVSTAAMSYYEDSSVFGVFVLLSITAFSEVVLAIGTASYSCCCSHLQTTNMPNDGTNQNTTYETQGGNNQNSTYPAQGGTNQKTAYPAQGGTNQNTAYPAQGGTNQNTAYLAQGGTNQNTTYPGQGGTNQKTTYPAQGGTNQNTAYPSAAVFDQSYVQD